MDYSDTEDETEAEENEIEVIKETEAEIQVNKETETETESIEVDKEIGVEKEVEPLEVVKETQPLCCIPCTVKMSDECKICIFCIDKPKYGGPNKLKQKCIKRTCLKKRKRAGTSTSTTSRKSMRHK